MAVSSFMNRLPRLAGNHSLAPLLVGGLFLGVGALVGLVVATSNLVLIALVLGGIAGILLLNNLPIAVWLILIGVFLINGPVGYFSPGMAKISWLFSLLGIFMAGAAMLYSVAGREHFKRPMPPFIYTSLAFIVMAVVSGFISDGSLAEIAAGAKRYFHFWGVMFLMAVVPFTEKQVRNWLLFIVGVGLVQLPFTLYQRVVLVPGVMGYDKPGFVPFDIIVGSFEGSMTGGGASSIMAMIIVMVLFGVFCAWREKLLSGFWTLFLTIGLLVPLGLGETKVVMIMMPVVLFSAYFDLVAKRPLAFLGIVVATIVFGGILGYFYFMVQVSGDIADMSFDENLRDTLEYNLGNRGYYATGVNRLTAVPYWFESQSWNNPVKALFGTGIGSSYGVDGLVPDPGHMFLAHPGMYIDLLTTSTVLWDFGIVGFILYFMILFGAMRTVARCFKEAHTAWDRVLLRMLMSSLAVTLLMAMYSNSAIVLVSHAFIVSLTLGLVAWRYRYGPLSPTKADLLQAGQDAGRSDPRFARREMKDIFPMDGVLTPQELAMQQQRLLGHTPGVAADAGRASPSGAGPRMGAGPAGAAGRGAAGAAGMGASAGTAAGMGAAAGAAHAASGMSATAAGAHGGAGQAADPARAGAPADAAQQAMASLASAGATAKSAFPKGPIGRQAAPHAAQPEAHPGQAAHPQAHAPQTASQGAPQQGHPAQHAPTQGGQFAAHDQQASSAHPGMAARQPGAAPAASGYPASGHPAAGHPASAHPAQGHIAPGQASPGRAAPGRAAPGQPASPAQGYPASAQAPGAHPQAGAGAPRGWPQGGAAAQGGIGPSAGGAPAGAPQSRFPQGGGLQGGMAQAGMPQGSMAAGGIPPGSMPPGGATQGPVPGGISRPGMGSPSAYPPSGAPRGASPLPPSGMVPPAGGGYPGSSYPRPPATQPGMPGNWPAGGTSRDLPPFQGMGQPGGGAGAQPGMPSGMQPGMQPAAPQGPQPGGYPGMSRPGAPYPAGQSPYGTYPGHGGLSSAPPMGPTVRPPWEQAAPAQRPVVPPQVAQNAPRSSTQPGYPEEGQPLPRPRARRTAYFGPQGQPGEDGAEDWEELDLQGGASRVRGNQRPAARPRGEPIIDDVLSPSTRPMFADDDEPANGMNLDGGSGKGRRR